MAKGLTKRQENILQYVLDYVEREGYPPSIREIGRDFSIGSLRGVTVHLDALERKGYIVRSNTPRSIKVVHPKYQQNNRVVMVPLYDSAVAAGLGLEMQEHAEESVPVPPEMLHNAKNAFVLRISGDSMIGDGILDRDLVVVRPQSTALHGDLVAVALGSEATVKRIHFASDGVTLIPSNPKFSPIPIKQEDSRIIGKVVGLLRTY